MLNGLMWLLGCQLAGELVVATLGLPVPGPVVGMVLLFALLQWRRPDRDADVFTFSDKMLRHLQLFFIPAGAGIFTYLTVVGDHAVPIVVAIVVSWLLALVVTGLVVAGLTRLTTRRRGA